MGGEQLAPYSRLRMEGPGADVLDDLKDRPPARYTDPAPFKTPFTTSMGYPKEWATRIKLADDAAVGPRPWRITSAQGGTSARLFVVGDLPEMVEEESNSRLEKADRAKYPVTINGQFNPREDVDHFRVTLRRGQSISCDVVAQRLGSAADPVLDMLDSAGLIVQSADDTAGRDPRLRFTAPKAGEYTLRLHDAAYAGGLEFVYRLTITEEPLVEYAFPAGGRRGTTATVGLFTSEGPARSPQSVNMPSEPGARVRMITSSTGASPLALVVGSYAEIMEQEPNDTLANRIAAQATINGQIQRLSDIDSFVFAAKKGEQWTIECLSEALRSPLKPVVSVLGPGGKIALATEGSAGGVGNPRLSVTAPSDGDYTVTVKDLHGTVRGGPSFIYRLTIAQAAPDFSLGLSADFVDVKRGASATLDLVVGRSPGFTGAIDLQVEGLPAGVTFSPAQILAGAIQAKITFAAAADADLPDAELRLTGRAMLPSGEIIRPALAPYSAAPAGQATVGPAALDHFLLTVTHPPLFEVHTDDTYTYTPKGTVYPAPGNVVRSAGFDGEIRIRIADRQIRDLDGFDAEELVVEPRKSSFGYLVHLPETLTMLRPSRVFVLGTSIIKGKDGRLHGLLAVAPKFIVITSTAPLLGLSLDREEVEVNAGTAVRLTASLQRSLDFPDEAEITLELPTGAKGISLSPCRVAKGQTKAELLLTLEKGATLGRDSKVRFCARSTRNGYPVLAYRTVELVLGR